MLYIWGVKLADKPSLVEVVERYRDYEPPLNAAAIAGRILSYVPPQYLAGLNGIVLTNMGTLSRRRMRSQASLGSKASRVLGLYHRATKANEAWIEIFVDNIFNDWPKFALKIPLIRELALAFTINHEVGHHIQIYILKGNYEEEGVAGKWERRLSRTFVQRRFWYLWPVLYLA